FLPVVRRLLDKTPPDGQRLLFSATLDAAVDVLVRRFLTNPVTHSVDSAQSPVAAMSHHVLHVAGDSRVPVLVDLTSAPGRTLVFTRTKHGAKILARKLTAAGVPALELHGNLSQNARTRNLTAFSDGTTNTLVATDIAARGIHVDDVSLVVHADPPVEHKAYLHRSGRTARAGAEGTVVTLMTDAQVSDVRDLTRRAGIKPMITRLSAGHPLLAQIAPGKRELDHRAAISNLDDRTAKRSGTRRSGHGRGSRRGAGEAVRGGAVGGYSSDGTARRSPDQPARHNNGAAGSRRQTSRQRGYGGSAAQSASSAAAFSAQSRPAPRRRNR
nr:DEAD/DEAH box helicase [Nocardioidaceae bacterium]